MPVTTGNRTSPEGVIACNVLKVQSEPLRILGVMTVPYHLTLTVGVPLARPKDWQLLLRFSNGAHDAVLRVECLHVGLELEDKYHSEQATIRGAWSGFRFRLGKRSIWASILGWGGPVCYEPRCSLPFRLPLSYSCQALRFLTWASPTGH